VPACRSRFGAGRDSGQWTAKQNSGQWTVVSGQQNQSSDQKKQTAIVDRRQKSDVRKQNLPAEAASAQAGTEDRKGKSDNGQRIR
jgi:hypothetical protein